MRVTAPGIFLVDLPELVDCRTPPDRRAAQAGVLAWLNYWQVGGPKKVLAHKARKIKVWRAETGFTTLWRHDIAAAPWTSPCQVPFTYPYVTFYLAYLGWITAKKVQKTRFFQNYDVITSRDVMTQLPYRPVQSAIHFSQFLPVVFFRRLRRKRANNVIFFC